MQSHEGMILAFKFNNLLFTATVRNQVCDQEMITLVILKDFLDYWSKQRYDGPF
jgi:hypothetical protein